MSHDYEYTYHLFDEREFRDRFLPAVQGNEPIVREMLDAANASGPSWTALHKLFDETRASFQQAVDARDGEAAQRTIFAAFGRLLAHLRPAHIVRGFTLSHIDRAVFPELTAYVKSPGTLLQDDGGKPLKDIPHDLVSRVPSQCVAGRSGGGVILKADVRPFLKQLRADMPRLATWLTDQGMPAEAGLTMLLSAVVGAKLKGSALFEASDVLLGDPHMPKSHKLSFDKPQNLPPAVVREVGKVFGREASPKKKVQAPPPAPPPETKSYTPQGCYEVGQRLEHKSFGTGEVTRILDSRRMKVAFTDEERTLAQGLPNRRDREEE